MAKPEFEFFDPKDLPWRQSSSVVGLNECILSEDPESGAITRFLKFEPGVSSEGVQIHDFWEELCIIDGSIYDLNLNETFSKGYYGCRPPGMKHGPWKSENGALLFECRYYSK